MERVLNERMRVQIINKIINDNMERNKYHSPDMWKGCRRIDKQPKERKNHELGLVWRKGIREGMRRDREDGKQDGVTRRYKTNSMMMDIENAIWNNYPHGQRVSTQSSTSVRDQRPPLVCTRLNNTCTRIFKPILFFRQLTAVIFLYQIMLELFVKLVTLPFLLQS